MQAEAQVQASTNFLNKIRDELDDCKIKLKGKEGEVKSLKSSENALQSSLASSRELATKLKVDVEELKVWTLSTMNEIPTRLF